LWRVDSSGYEDFAKADVSHSSSPATALAMTGVAFVAGVTAGSNLDGGIIVKTRKGAVF
jgi:hypothetical protein